MRAICLRRSHCLTRNLTLHFFKQHSLCESFCIFSQTTATQTPPRQKDRDFLVATYGEANARAMTQSIVGAISDIIEKHGGELSRSRADTITCPVLLIVGEQDFFVPLASVSELAARVRTAEVLVAEDAGHNVYAELPEWLTQTILDWLGNH
jgi:pimeloyl-ACP methyl ester carboxylesterase